MIYPVLLSLVCSMLSEQPTNQMAAVGVFLSWAVLACAPLDALENWALLRMLDSGPATGPSRLAGWCAGLKFSLACAAVGYAALHGLAVAAGKLRGA